MRRRKKNPLSRLVAKSDSSYGVLLRHGRGGFEFRKARPPKLRCYGGADTPIIPMSRADIERQQHENGVEIFKQRLGDAWDEKK